VAYVSRAKGRAIARARLRELLGVEESYLSHLLADLEAAGLIMRIRRGRAVSIHLGPVAESEHVKELLPILDAAVQRVHEAFEYILGEEPDGTSAGIEGSRELKRQAGRVRRELEEVETRIEQTIAGGNQIVCLIRVSGRKWGAPVVQRLIWAAEMREDAEDQIRRVAQVRFAKSTPVPYRSTVILGGALKERMIQAEPADVVVENAQRSSGELATYWSQAFVDAFRPTRETAGLEPDREADNVSEVNRLVELKGILGKVPSVKFVQEQMSSPMRSLEPAHRRPASNS
jgi:DNA-binding MarR family transcriptional regulator